jgi:transcriptional regulator with XRE-family HTH domain
MTIGQRIKRRRKELRMTADELGAQLGKDRSTIYRYENGEIENMPLDVLEPIAQALQTTPQHLMGWEETQKKNDTVADIVLKLNTDKDFLDLVAALYRLDADKIRGIKELLKAFL